MKPELRAVGLILIAAAVGVGLAFQLEPTPTSAPVAEPQDSRPDSGADIVALSARMEEAQAAQRAREVAWKKIQPHLAAAQSASYEAIDKHSRRLREFFAERRKRARPFAEKSLSFGSKWAFAKSKLPFTDEDGHKKYLHEQFEEIVFTSADLDKAIQSAVKGCVAELQGIENNLLVKIRADLSDEALGALKDDVRFSTEAAFREEYARSVEKAAKTFSKDLPVWGGQIAVSFVGADIGAIVTRSVFTSVMSRLGLSGTIFGGSTATGVITFGGAFAAGYVIDALLDHLLRVLGYDPQADVEQKVVESLQYCEDFILDGESWADLGRFVRNSPGGVLKMDELTARPSAPAKKPSAPAKMPAAPKEKKYEKCGLYDQLFLLASGRARLRAEALRKLLLEGDGR